MQQDISFPLPWAGERFEFGIAIVLNLSYEKEIMVKEDCFRGSSEIMNDITMIVSLDTDRQGQGNLGHSIRLRE